MFRITNEATRETRDISRNSKHWPKEITKSPAFVYTTSERNAKQSTWIDDWSTVPLDREYWTASGLLVKRVPEEASAVPNLAYWRRKLGSGNLCDAFAKFCAEDVQQFLELPIEDQFKLLRVPKEDRPPFYKHKDAAVSYVKLVMDRRKQERDRYKRALNQRRALGEAEADADADADEDEDSRLRTLAEYRTQ